MGSKVWCPENLLKSPAAGHRSTRPKVASGAWLVVQSRSQQVYCREGHLCPWPESGDSPGAEGDGKL